MGAAHDAAAAVVAQWRDAAAELERVRRDELGSLDDEEALAAIEELLALIDVLPPGEHTSSGLVEQQRLFALARR